MERLTPGVQTAYPVERTIMETGSESTSQKKAVKKTPEARMAEIVKKFSEKQQEKSQNIRKKGDKEERVSGSGGTSGGKFDKFDPDKFKGNSSLEELAKLVKAAARQGKLDAQFLEDIKTQLDRRTQLGLVSDNWNRNFTDYLNEFIVSANLSEAKGEDKELSQDVEAIVAQRKSSGLTAEQVQASRAAMEAAFGRKLTEAELQRATLGPESMRGTTSEAFELQMRSIESLIDNPKKYEAFLKTVSTQNPEIIKKALSGPEGKLVLGVLLGDIAEREKFVAKFDEILKKDPRGVSESLPSLINEIRQEEAQEKVQIDPERQRIAREQAERWLREQRQKRELSIEEVETVIENAEKGIGIIGGGTDYSIEVDNLLEELEQAPDEFNEFFKRLRIDLAEKDLVEAMAGEMHENDPTLMLAEKNRFLELKNIDDPREFKLRYRQLIQDLHRRHQRYMSAPDRATERIQQEADARGLTKDKVINKGSKSFDIRDLDELIEAISPPKRGERPFFEREPRNVVEVAAWIMAGDDRSIWGRYGEYPIFELTDEIDPATGRQKAKFNEHNFIRWLRNKALEHHADNPNDPLNLLQGISIETMFKSISILTMKYNKQKYFQDLDGKPLSNLADEVINEAWLFGVRRNKNLGYIQSMNSDEKLFEAIVEMSGKNDHTGGKNLANHFQMGENFSDTDKNKDNMVGDAMLAANQIYRNISDIDKLRQILPPDSPIFTVEGFKNASRYLNGQGFDEDTKGFGNLKIEGNRVYFLDPKTKIRTEIFRQDKSLVSDANLVKFLNFFPEATPQETNETFVRELAKQSIAELVGFETGVKKEEYDAFAKERREKLGEDYTVSIEDYRKIKRMNLEWAETNSWVEQRWNGAAARNDTGYRGYDAWTKMYAQYYRERQSGHRTAGPIGNPEDLQIFRMLTPDMWLAIRTESGESVHEVFEDLHMLNRRLYSFKGDLTPEQEQEKKDVEERKKELYEKLRFPRWTESDWASNGVKRQSEVWHNIMNTEDIKFSEIVKRDNWGILRFDRQKFEEVVKDDFIKKRRYAFSSNNAMNYGTTTRMRIRDVIRDKDGKIVMENGKPKVGFVFKDMFLAEAMFGESVVGPLRDDWYSGKAEYKYGDENGKEITKRAQKKGEKFDPNKHGTYAEYLNSAGQGEARERILKNICRAGLAAQIKAHRQWTGLDERWDAHAIRKFYQAIRSMPEYMENPVTGKEEPINNSQFFSKEDIKWIRNYSGTTQADLLMEEIGSTSVDILSESLPGAFKIFFDDIIA